MQSLPFPPPSAETMRRIMASPTINLLPKPSSLNEHAPDAHPSKEQKKKERLMKNRISAQLHRERKREQAEILESQAKAAIAENESLKIQLEDTNKLVQDLYCTINKQNDTIKSQRAEIDSLLEPQLDDILTESDFLFDDTLLCEEEFSDYSSSNTPPVSPDPYDEPPRKRRNLGRAILLAAFIFSISLFGSETTEKVPAFRESQVLFPPIEIEKAAPVKMLPASSSVSSSLILYNHKQAINTPNTHMIKAYMNKLDNDTNAVILCPQAVGHFRKMNHEEIPRMKRKENNTLTLFLPSYSFDSPEFDDHGFVQLGCRIEKINDRPV